MNEAYHEKIDLHLEPLAEVAATFAKTRRLLLRRRRLLRFLGPLVGSVRDGQRIAARRLERVDAELADLVGFGVTQ